MSDQVNIFNLYLENASKQEPEMRIDEDGTKKWFLNSKLHREHGPAIEWADGTKEWWLHGKLHREHGPAIEYANGTKAWYQHSKLHREDGPAIERADGNKAWYLHDKPHREDGPAIEWADGTKVWYLHGKRYNDAESWAQAVLKMHHKPATPDDVQRFLRSIYKKKSLL